MLTVFTAADRRYEPFVAPYIASVLAHNPATVVEIALEEPERYRAQHVEVVRVLDRYFPGRYELSPGNFARKKTPPNSVRFLETPRRRGDYIYIGDIDILVLEAIEPVHLTNMERTGLPYSNVQRPGQKRLTGLHFSRWDAFYPQPAVPGSLVNLDEFYLYDLVAARGLPLPDPTDVYRPIHGYHLSLNCDPRVAKGKTWDGVRTPQFAQTFAHLRAIPLWLDLAPHFDECYKRMLFALEVLLAVRFPDEMATSPPTPGLDLKAGW